MSVGGGVRSPRLAGSSLRERGVVTRLRGGCGRDPSPEGRPTWVPRRAPRRLDWGWGPHTGSPVARGRRDARGRAAPGSRDSGGRAGGAHDSGAVTLCLGRRCVSGGLPRVSDKETKPLHKVGEQIEDSAVEVSVQRLHLSPTGTEKEAAVLRRVYPHPCGSSFDHVALSARRCLPASRVRRRCFAPTLGRPRGAFLCNASASRSSDRGGSRRSRPRHSMTTPHKKVSYKRFVDYTQSVIKSTPF